LKKSFFGLVLLSKKKVVALGREKNKRCKEIRVVQVKCKVKGLVYVVAKCLRPSMPHADQAQVQDVSVVRVQKERKVQVKRSKKTNKQSRAWTAGQILNALIRRAVIVLFLACQSHHHR